MNQTGQSAFNQARIEWAIRLRFSPMPRLDPEVMSSQLNAFRIGELRVVGKTWECQMERDGELAVNAVKRCSDLAALPYQVVSDGSPDGDKHAAALTYFYRHARVTKALDQDSVGGISDLLRQMASAHSYYYSAHEMLLRVDNPAGKEVTAEFRHTPVWFFESRRGYLAYLKHIFDVYGQPCVQGEWLTCVGEGWMRPLSIAFCMKAFSLRDWNIWCARYASGFLEGIVDEAPGTTGWEEAKSALQTMANDGAVVHSPKVILKFLEQTARSGMPFKELVDLVNSLYAKCYRGVDLATGSKSGGSSAGAGGGSSNVVGASVQSEESGIYLASDALWATGYLNDRVDRPIIRYLFNQEPRAAISVSPPPDDTTDEDLKVVQALVPLGWKIALKDVYKRFRWEAPADGEPCLQAPVPLGPPKPGDGGSAPGVSGAVPSTPIIPKSADTPAAPKTADETEETTQAAQEDETAPIGAGADPASLGKPQTFAPEMPDPQVDAAGFWSSAGAALRSIFGPFVNKTKPVDRMTDGTLPALATAIPNQSQTDSPRPSEEASRKKLASATHADLAYAAAKVKALLQITDPDHFAARAKEVMGEWDSVTANTLMVPKAADALAPVIGTAYAQGLSTLRSGNATEDGQRPSAALGNGDVPGHEFHGNQYVEISDEKWTGSVKEMRKKSDTIMRGFKPAHNPELGDVTFSKTGRSKTLGTKTTPHQFQSVQALPPLIEKGKVVSSEDDRQGRHHIVKLHTIEHGLKIGKAAYKAQILVREVRTGSGTTKTAQQFYLHKIQEEKAGSHHSKPALSGETSSPSGHSKTTS